MAQNLHKDKRPFVAVTPKNICVTYSYEDGTEFTSLYAPTREGAEQARDDLIGSGYDYYLCSSSVDFVEEQGVDPVVRRILRAEQN